MSRQKVRDNNWSGLGKLIIDIWAKRPGPDKRTVLEALKDPSSARNVLQYYGVDLEPGIKRIEVHEDTGDTLHIVVPKNPWSEDELRRMEEVETYLRELGIIVMGGCR